MPNQNQKLESEWTLLRDTRPLYALYRCSCGVEKEVLKSNVDRFKSKSCGHARRIVRPAVGESFGDWTVDLVSGSHYVEATCSCGVSSKVYVYSLINGESTSCGHKRATGPRSRLKWMYEWMVSRCYNDRDPMYRYYGERGIGVCKEWRNDPDRYIDWAIANGFKKSSGLQVDRIDNDKGYSPENCRVTTVEVNANNKSNNVRITAFGEEKTVGEWAKDPRCVVSYATLWARRKAQKMSPERMITRPARSGASG